MGSHKNTSHTLYQHVSAYFFPSGVGSLMTSAGILRPLLQPLNPFCFSTMSREFTPEGLCICLWLFLELSPSHPCSWPLLLSFSSVSPPQRSPPWRLTSSHPACSSSTATSSVRPPPLSPLRASMALCSKLFSCQMRRGWEANCFNPCLYR